MRRHTDEGGGEANDGKTLESEATTVHHVFDSGIWAGIGRFLSAILTPLIAVIAVYIAGQQFVINRRQHRLALFEKRIAVFNSTMTMIAAVVQTANPSLADCMKFIQDTRHHEFLFGPEVKTFIDEVYKQAVALHTLIAVGPHNAAQETAVMTWFIGQLEEAKQVFLPYLDFRKP